MGRFIKTSEAILTVLLVAVAVPALGLLAMFMWAIFASLIKAVVL